MKRQKISELAAECASCCQMFKGLHICHWKNGEQPWLDVDKIYIENVMKLLKEWHFNHIKLYFLDQPNNRISLELMPNYGKFWQDPHKFMIDNGKDLDDYINIMIKLL